MIVDDLDIFGSGCCPSKADAPLVVDPNRVLADSIALQFLQMIPRWRPKIVQINCIGHSTQTSFSSGD